jgi:hypothetical protein
MDMQRDRHGLITWLQKKDDSGMLHTHVLMWVARSWICMLMWLVALIEDFDLEVLKVEVRELVVDDVHGAFVGAWV